MFDREKNLRETKNKNKRIYNSMPEDYRVIAGRIILEMRIKQLEREKARVKKAFDRSMTVINKHIRSLENYILRNDRFETGRTKEIEE